MWNMKPIVEVGSFQGHEALVSDEILVGYVQGLALMTWSGETCLARLEVVGTRGKWRGNREPLTSYRAVTPDGRRFHGRGLGEGMILKLRRNAHA
jgi:hypothetical protein